MAASHVLKNTNALLEVTFSVGNADAGVTATVVRADGTTLTSGAATQTAPTGHYTFTLAPQTELDSLTITWAGTFSGVAQSVQTFAEIVGGYLFSLADARAFGDGVLANATTYPDAALRQARERITDLFDQVCGCSFIPRYARDTMDGTSVEAIQVYNVPVRRVIAASVDGTALTSPELAALVARPSGIIVRQSGIWGWRMGGLNVVIAYEHGYPNAPPDIQQAGMMLARYELVSSDLSDRAISLTTEYGTQMMVTAGGPMQNPTNLPYVNSVLARYTRPEALVS